MRIFIYAVCIINAIIGLVLIYRKPGPFRGKTYRDLAGKEDDQIYDP